MTPLVRSLMGPSASSFDYGYVTSIQTPGKFYVQRISNDEAFDVIHEVIFEASPHSPRQTPPEVGDIVLARSESDRLLYRAQVVEANDGEEDVQIHFLDIGHDQWIPAADLLEIPSEILEFPPLVEECGIHHLYPNSANGEWTEEARNMLLDLTGQNLCMIEIMNTEEDRLLVDLLVIPEDLVVGDPISVKATLLFCRMGVIGDPRNAVHSPAMSPPPPKPTLKSFERYFTANSTVFVQLARIRSPDEIYVRPQPLIGKRGEKFSAMQDEMKQLYDARDVKPIYQPEVGDLLVYKDRLGSFHRASVVSAPVGRMSTIFLPDQGRYRVASPSHLFPMVSPFTKYPVMAIRVRLHDVKPISTKWGFQNIEWLRTICRDRLEGESLKMLIREVDDGEFKVELLHGKESISEFVVEQGFAHFKKKKK